jgi:zinc transport system substrate-binding protein
MPKKYWVTGGLIALTVLIINMLLTIKMILPGPEATVNQPVKINVVATFYPLADFAAQVGGQYVTVTNITPPGAEPHDFEPSPKDIAKIYGAKLFITNGYGADAWAEKITPQLESNQVAVIKMSDHVGALKNTDPDLSGTEYDPHFWLDPINASTEVDVIANALIQIDSAHTKEYNQNRNSFKQKLLELDQEFQTGLAHCKSRTIVTTHNAFGYLAKRYNLQTQHILGLSPEEEPSPKKIAEISNVAKQQNIKYIFFETIIDQKLSRTIAQEIGAQTLVLNPIEGLLPEEIKNNKNYLTIMKDNLTNLKTALICQ